MTHVAILTRAGDESQDVRFSTWRFVQSSSGIPHVGNRDVPAGTSRSEDQLQLPPHSLIGDTYGVSGSDLAETKSPSNERHDHAPG